MKQIVVMMLALVAGVELSTSALVVETVSDGAGVSIFSNDGGDGNPPAGDPPEGEPPDGYGGGTGGGGTGGGGEGGGGQGGEGGGGAGGGEGGGGQGGGTSPGGGSDDSVILTGAYQYTSETNTLVGQTLESATSDQNVVLAMTNAYVTVSNCVLNKSGDTSSEDNSNFYALNAVVAAKTASKICIDNSTLNSNANGANCLFASGEGSTIYAHNCMLSSTKGSSRGLDATYGGTVIASKMTINTESEHCASLATDRGNGYISATDSTLSTAGQGSALIYSTGVIEVNGVTGTATGAQIAGIEGLSVIRIKNSDLTGSGEKASEPVANGVIIYQSNSGDSTDGTATFEVSDSTLNSAITNGAMFYITHSEAVITVQNTILDFDTDKNCLLKAAGNDGSNGWGSAGSNGAEVVFTAIDQTLAGTVSVDGISSLDMYLANSKYTGTFENDTTYTGSGDGIELFINSNSTWTVTADCTLKSLTVADGATIVDGDEKAVRVVNSSGTELRAGTSDFKITVSNYTSGEVAITNAITAFEIDRTAFEAMYALSQGDGGGSGSGSGSGGASDHNNWTNYFKPFPPDNAIVKVKIEGATEYGTPDRDHKYCLDGYWNGEASGVVVHLLYVTTEGYLFADGCTSNKWDVTITNNAQEVHPPADVVAIKTQAKSGRTYYLTLKEAIDAAGNRSKITLNDNVTLEETLTITNSITLNLATNVITLASALTNAFVFTSKTTTISNGTINSSLATNVAGSVMLRFTNCKATLKDLTIDGCGYEKVIYCSGNGTVATDGVWVDGQLYGEASEELVTPGVASEAYDDAQSATNAAVAINDDKAGSIAVPTGVEDSSAYYEIVEATVTSDNCVVVDLTPVARSNEQAVVETAVTNEAVVAALVSTNATAKATIAKTTPGLYYWIQGGTDVEAVAQPGTPVLSKDGGSIELSKPALDATQGKAFFKIAAGVAAPAQ